MTFEVDLEGVAEVESGTTMTAALVGPAPLDKSSSSGGGSLNIGLPGGPTTLPDLGVTDV